MSLEEGRSFRLESRIEDGQPSGRRVKTRGWEGPGWGRQLALGAVERLRQSTGAAGGETTCSGVVVVGLLRI